jgi:hypothetical protein
MKIILSEPWMNYNYDIWVKNESKIYQKLQEELYKYARKKYFQPKKLSSNIRVL